MRAFIIAAVLLGASFTACGAQSADVALSKNWMRLFGGPSMDYPRIGMINFGQGLKVLGCNGKGWCEVVADGQNGWVPDHTVLWPATPSNRMMETRKLERVTI